jgi:hypothetical protein
VLSCHDPELADVDTAGGCRECLVAGCCLGRDFAVLQHASGTGVCPSDKALFIRTRSGHGGLLAVLTGHFGIGLSDCQWCAA